MNHLGGRHAYLGTRVDVYAAVRLPAHGGPDHVGNADDEGPLGLAVPERQQCVVGLSRLRDEEADVIPEDWGPAVVEVRGVLHHHRQLRQLL